MAARLAARSGDELQLVHVVEAGVEHVFGGARPALVEAARNALEAERARLVALGAKVVTAVLEGAPDEAIVRRAADERARLIVVGAVSHRAAAVWRLGGTAARIARSSEIPVLVMRGSSIDALDAWARGERTLRVLVGVDRTRTADAALRWLDELARFGPLDVVMGHVYWPPGEYRRLGLRGAMPLVGGHSSIEERLVRELVERTRALRGGWTVRIRCQPGFGRTVDHLVSLAEEEKADLLVVGTHRREGLGRLWRGSVSYGVLDAAPMSVACVPEAAALVSSRQAAIPRMRVVLVPTDFSPRADRAIPYAYSIVEPDGVVHLLHVVSEPPGDEKARLEAELLDRIPQDAPPETTQVEVAVAGDVAEAIAQAAERVGADAICMGSQGRTGLWGAVLGSVAQAVLGRTRRPILLVRPEE